MRLFKMDYFKTQKGKDACRFNGHGYRLGYIGQSTKTWRCMEKSCNSALLTGLNSEEPFVRGEHTCNMQPEVVDVKKIMCYMKEQAKNSTISVPQIYMNASIDVSSNLTVASVFPTFRSVDSTLYRARHSRYPRLPTTIDEIQIPEHLGMTASRELFLLHQEADRSIIVFGTIRNAELSTNYGHWFMDGTFSSTPILFQQLFTIHILIREKVIPIFYCLLTRKTEAIYRMLFQALKNIYFINHLNISPTIITVDFEAGLLTALRQEFPQSIIRGCFFHFCQSIYRKIQQGGLAQTYNDDEILRVEVRMLMALAFLPETLVFQTFAALRANATEILRPLYEYFYNTWIIGYGLEIWNMYGIQRRTNNAVEGWHSRFNKLTLNHHMNIYEFLEAIIKEQAHTETHVAQIRAGQVVNRQNRLYQQINIRISNLQQQFDVGEITPIEYIRGVSLNLANPLSF